MLLRGNGNGHGTDQPVETASWSQRNSLIAESYRTTLTSILFSRQNSDRPRLLVFTSALWAILFVIVVFVIGEMLWVPTSQAVVAELAPADIRGAYMGAFGSAPAIGFALAPLIGLQVRNSFGDEATWAMFAAIGVVAAVLGGLALAGLDRRARRGTSAVLEA